MQMENFNEVCIRDGCLCDTYLKWLVFLQGTLLLV